MMQSYFAKLQERDGRAKAGGLGWHAFCEQQAADHTRLHTAAAQTCQYSAFRPDAGSVGAEAVESAAVDRIITVDMGGTYSDVAWWTGSPNTNEADVAGCPYACRGLIFTRSASGGGHWPDLPRGGALAWGPNRPALIPVQSAMAKANVPRH